MISHDEKEHIAGSLRRWLETRPELSLHKLYRQIGVSKSTFSNFMSNTFLLKIEKMVALEMILEAKFGYDRVVTKSLPESYVPVQQKPPKKGLYIIKGPNKEGKTDYSVARYNGLRFYKHTGIKAEYWRPLPL